MSVDTTPAILVTDGPTGQREYRSAIVQNWGMAWEPDYDEPDEKIVDMKFVVDVFWNSPVCNSLEEARAQIAAMVVAGDAIEEDEDVLDLSEVGDQRIGSILLATITPLFTFQDLVRTVALEERAAAREHTVGV